MKYIKFSNKAGNVNRLGLEKLGYSTKRNDPNTIGQFGSGIKLAPISALRTGHEWHFIGKDEQGPFHLEYIVQEEQGINCIAYKYDDTIKSSSFTIDAGSLSWDSPFQIYREAFANAIDSAESNDDWSITIVDKEDMVYEDGFFNCYVTASPALMEIHNDFDHYFAVNREMLFNWFREWDNREYKILKKIRQSSVSIYSFGIRVFYSEDYSSVFDYDIKNIPLNEERSVKSMWDLETEIARIISRINDTSLHSKYFDICIGGSAEDYFEFAKIGLMTWQSMAFHTSWKESFFDRFGTNAIIFDEVAAARGIRDYLKIRGFYPIYVPSVQSFTFMQAAGVPTYSDIADESVMYDANFDIEKMPRFQNALSIAKEFLPELEDVISSKRIGVYSGDSIAIGLTINMNKDQEERIILIDEKHIKESAMEDIVGTIVHEYDHLSTGFSDGNLDGRAFRDLADQRIGKLMVKFYQGMPCSIENGLLYFDMNKITAVDGFSAKFDIEPVYCIGKFVLKVGKMIFSIEGDIHFNGSRLTDPISGFLSVAETGTDFTIYGLTNVEKVAILNV